MLGALLAVVMTATDGGAATVAQVRQVMEHAALAHQLRDQQQLAETVARLKEARAGATPQEAALIDRMVRLLDLDPEPRALFQGLLQLNRDLLPLATGDFPTERALVASFLSAPFTAQNLGLDPAPLKEEALRSARELVARYPGQGSAHAVLASALGLTSAPLPQILAAYQRCARLDAASSCAQRHAEVLARAEQPFCPGSALIKPLTFTGARDAADHVDGTPLTHQGVALTVERAPFLRSAHVESLRVDEAGDLSVTLTAEGAAVLARESRRLADTHSGWVLLRSGEDLLMAPRVMEAIAQGNLRVTHGASPAFTLTAFCARPVHPVVDAKLKLP